MKANGRIQLYPLLRLAVMLIVGIVVGDSLFGQVPLWAWMAATAGFSGVACVMWKKPVGQSCVLMATVMTLGAWVLTAKRQADAVALPTQAVAYKAVVLSRPVQHGRVVACDLLLCDGTFWGRKMKATILRDTVEQRYRSIGVGDVLCACSRLEKPDNFRTSGRKFDYRRWMAVHGFFARTFIYYRNWEKTSSTLSRLTRLQRMQVRLLCFRERLRSQFDTVEADQQAVAVVAAMSLGDKATLSKDLKDAYNITGAAHVLALSGLHLGIIYFLLTFFLSRRRWFAVGQALAIVAIWGYAMMVGLMPSVVRAATMYSLCALVSLMNRDRLSLNTLAFAALAMLMANPLTLWDVGFQMSFMSVLGIVVLFKPFYGLAPSWKLNRWPVLKWAWSMCCVSMAAQLLVAPLVMFYFGRFSCYFLLTNFVAVPLTTIIIYGAVLGFFLMPFSALQAVVLKATFFVAGVLNDSLGWLSRLPGSSIEAVEVNVAQVVLMYVLLASVCGLAVYGVRMYRSAHGQPWGNYPR